MTMLESRVTDFERGAPLLDRCAHCGAQVFPTMSLGLCSDDWVAPARAHGGRPAFHLARAVRHGRASRGGARVRRAPVSRTRDDTPFIVPTAFSPPIPTAFSLATSEPLAGSPFQWAAPLHLHRATSARAAARAAWGGRMRPHMPAAHSQRPRAPTPRQYAG